MQQAIVAILSEDTILAVALMLSPEDYARLGACCKSFRALLTPARFLCMRGAPAHVTTLHSMSLHKAVENIGCNRVAFEGMSTELRDGQHVCIAAYSALLRSYSQAQLHIDAHTGRNAPRTYARPFTRARADAVRALLVARGVSSEQITCTGWGNSVAVHAHWPPGISSARAELHIEVDSIFLPPRPEYYAEAPPALTPEQPEDSSESESSEALPELLVPPALFHPQLMDMHNVHAV